MIISERSPVPEKDQAGTAFSDSDWLNFVQVKTVVWFERQCLYNIINIILATLNC